MAQHINSTIMGTGPENLLPGRDTTALGLVAHEFLPHRTSSVCAEGDRPVRLRAGELYARLLDRRRTTSYYDDLILVRTGSHADRYLKSLAGNIREERMRPETPSSHFRNRA